MKTKMLIAVFCFLATGWNLGVEAQDGAVPEFSCSNWDSYSAQDFGDMATAGIIGQNGRKCRIAQGGANAACNWYVKYDIDGDATNDWVGLSFGGVPNVGGTGCCASVNGCSTLAGAGAWLKSHHKEYCCAPEFSCSNWDSYSAQEFGDMATAGIIGENGRKCRIAQGGANAACNWYVKYDIDGDATNDWVGLSFGGVPNVGGTGCCASVNGCSTLAGAGAWLKSHHKEYCCAPEFSCSNWDSYSAQEFGDMATAGIIGENGRKCRIAQGGANAACNWYVKYDIDGDATNDWVGLSFGGVPNVGGTGCCASVNGCSTLAGAGAWLKSHHKDYCCVPEFSCSNWDSYSAQDFGDMATAGIIGENGRKCRIAQGGANAACNWYVKYDIDGDATNDWVGLSFGGVPNVGGTGCCASVNGCSTLAGAGAWLKSRHQDYCCGSQVRSGSLRDGLISILERGQPQRQSQS